MARKVFISYKYKDELVKDLRKTKIGIVNGEIELVPRRTIVRDYVNNLEEQIVRDNIKLGEKDGESLVDLSDQHIETPIKSKIRQCSITIVLISKGMKTSD